MEEILDYYKVGNINDIVISNSALNTIDPEIGGSPQKFLEFFNSDIEKKNSHSMKTGSIVHEYIEKPSEFAVAEIDKPEGKIGDICDWILARPEIQNIEAITVLNEEEIFYLFGGARQVIDYYANRTNESTWKTFKEGRGLDYLDFVISNKDKTILTKNDKIVLENAISNLRKNTFTRGLFFESNLDVVVKKELELYVTIDGIKYKIKIDNLRIDHLNRTISIIDAKTTSGNAYNYVKLPQDIDVVNTSFNKWKVFRQLSLYTKVIEHSDHPIFENTENYAIEWVIVAIETKDQFNMVPFVIKGGAFEAYYIEGITQIGNLVRRVEKHKALNNWTDHLEVIENGFIEIC